MKRGDHWVATLSVHPIMILAYFRYVLIISKWLQLGITPHATPLEYPSRGGAHASALDAGCKKWHSFPGDGQEVLVTMTSVHPPRINYGATKIGCTHGPRFLLTRASANRHNHTLNPAQLTELTPNLYAYDDKLH